MQDFFCTFLNFFLRVQQEKQKPQNAHHYWVWSYSPILIFTSTGDFCKKSSTFLAFFWPFFKPCKSVSAHFFQRHFQVRIFISPPVVENLGKSQALFATFFNFFSSAYHGLHVAAHLYSRLLCRFRANLLQQLGVLLPLCDKRAANEDGTPAATYGGERG